MIIHVFFKVKLQALKCITEKEREQIPQAAKDLVIKNQFIESKDIGGEEPAPPPVKKKKI